MAVEMAELYWPALTADVPLHDYEASPLIGAAVSDITSFQILWARRRRERSRLKHYFAGRPPATLLALTSASELKHP
jgi:hypothetical protein